MQDTLRPEQWEALEAGLRKVEAHNQTLPEAQRRYVVINFVNTDDGPRRIKAIMPHALVCFRPVFSTHDPSPRNLDGSFANGQAWVERLWPHMAKHAPYVDYFIFANEWFGNKEPDHVVRGFVQFYKEVIAALPPGVKCTVGDWSIGCPGYPNIPGEANQIPILKELFDTCEATGNAVGMHLYAPQYNPQENVFCDGAVDMSCNAPYNFMRFEIVAKDHPKLVIVATEGSNAGKDKSGREGVFRPADTLNLMRQACGLIRASPYARNLKGVAWWWYGDGNTHQGAEADWSKDDFSSIARQFFDMLLEG